MPNDGPVSTSADPAGRTPTESAEPPTREISSQPDALTSSLELWAFRGLLWRLTTREVKVRYAQSVLGVAWAIAQPLALMAAFSLFFGRFAGIDSGGLPYPLFYYAALLPWTFFTTSLAFGVPSLVTNSSLVTKVYFPREILPLASILSAGVDFGAAAVVYGLFMALYGIGPSSVLLYLVPLLTVQLAFTTAITLILSALNVSYRDVRYALPLVTQLWLYATPVIYPLSAIPEGIRHAYLAVNPMAAIVDGYRSVLVVGTAPDKGMLGLSALVSMLLLLFGFLYFKRAERSFADVI